MLSGLLLAASFPPLHLLVPPFVALVPFAVWAARLPAGRRGARAATRGGLIMGAVAHGLLLHWLVPALAWTTPWAPVAFLLVVGTLSALSALFGAVLHRVLNGARAPLWLAIPVAWTATEWLRGQLPGPLAFPWLELSVGLTGFPELLGLAELVGGRGVSFWLALVSGLSAWVVVEWARSDRARRAVAVLVTVGVMMGPALWGLHRARVLETAPVARVAVVRTDLPAEARRAPAAWNDLMSPLVEDVLGRLEGRAFDLLVLPEGAVMVDRSLTDDQSPVLDRLATAASRHGASVLVGVYAGDAGPRNLAVLLPPDGGALDVYRKRRLVPWVEWRPGAGPNDRTGAPVLGVDLRDPGDTAPSVAGPLICYEAIFPEAARRARLAGADLLVNISNDAWFSASGGWGGVGRHQHAAHLVVRAVEHRVGAVRSTNGGPAYVVTPTGRTRPLASAARVSVEVMEVRSAPGPTPYTRTGDLTGAAAVLAVALLVWIGRLRGRQERATAATP